MLKLSDGLPEMYGQIDVYQTATDNPQLLSQTSSKSMQLILCDQIYRNMPDMIEAGASPRASIALILCAKANAFLDGRGYVDKEDIDSMALSSPPPQDNSIF